MQVLYYILGFGRKNEFNSGFNCKENLFKHKKGRKKSNLLIFYNKISEPFTDKRINKKIL